METINISILFKILYYVSEGLNSVETIFLSFSFIYIILEFQKDLIVWKLRLDMLPCPFLLFGFRRT